MKKIIEDLFKFERQLLGSGYDAALNYINERLPLEILSIKSGTKVGDWYIPNEWIVRDGWIKLNGEKIVDYKKDPLAVLVYSLPVNKKVKWAELKSHLRTANDSPDSHSYHYSFYERDWGFSIPFNKLKDLPDDAEYEVFVDSEDMPGEMKIGVHTIPGKTDREILLFAHLDHPYQANDNLSAVACLMDLASQLKDKFEHTIKIIFCPETIGSIAYAELSDISKVDFMIALDAVGNDNTLLFQKAFDTTHRLNYCAHLAVAGQGVSYRKGEFRFVVGSDEYYFNDPMVHIPGLFISRIPYKEYHTSDDTPDKINEDKIREVQKVVLKTIEFYEHDFIPIRQHGFGPLMRSRHDIQTGDKMMNRDLDYLYYNIDGKKWLSELVIGLGMGFEYGESVINKLINDHVLSRIDPGKVKE